MASIRLALLALVSFIVVLCFVSVDSFAKRAPKVAYTRYVRRRPTNYYKHKFVDEIVEVFDTLRKPPPYPFVSARELNRFLRCGNDPSLPDCDLNYRPHVRRPTTTGSRKGTPPSNWYPVNVPSTGTSTQSPLPSNWFPDVSPNKPAISATTTTTTTTSPRYSLFDWPSIPITTTTTRMPSLHNSRPEMIPITTTTPKPSTTTPTTTTSTTELPLLPDFQEYVEVTEATEEANPDNKQENAKTDPEEAVYEYPTDDDEGEENEEDVGDGEGDTNNEYEENYDDNEEEEEENNEAEQNVKEENNEIDDNEGNGKLNSGIPDATTTPKPKKLFGWF